MKRRGTPIVEAPKPTPIQAAIETVAQRQAEAEFADLVKLAESIFPREWNVRIEPFSDGVHVQVRYTVAHGRNPIEALKKAIDWYRSKHGGRIILPGR